MDIDYTVAALMFPAIPLMMTMYSNRFHTLARLSGRFMIIILEKRFLQVGKSITCFKQASNLLKYVMGFELLDFF